MWFSFVHSPTHLSFDSYKQSYVYDLLRYRGGDSENHYLSNDKTVLAVHSRFSLVGTDDESSQPMVNINSSVILTLF